MLSNNLKFPLSKNNIFLVLLDFMVQFQSVMKTKEFTDPYAFKISNDGPNLGLLDLSMLREEEDLMDFSDLISFSNVNVIDEELKQHHSGSVLAQHGLKFFFLFVFLHFEENLQVK